MSATIPEVTTPGDLGDQLAGFLRAMRRENVSVNTIQTYGTGVRLFAEYLIAHDFPTDTDDITAEHVTDWELDLLSRSKAATVHNRHRGLQRFWSWYIEKRERDMTDDERRRDTWRSPMAHMKPPKLPIHPALLAPSPDLRKPTTESFRSGGTVRLTLSGGKWHPQGGADGQRPVARG
jgi:Phage integrase, N-terminal SAM-like domain